MAEHGTRTRYVHGPCRCPECKAANRSYQHELQDRLRQRGVPTDQHGTTSSYGNYGCRCDACTQANKDKMAWYHYQRRNGLV